MADLEKMDAAQAEQAHRSLHGEAVHPQNVEHIVPHRFGFDESDIRVAFEGAGLESFSYERAIKAKQHGADVNIFLAKGSKPGGS